MSRPRETSFDRVLTVPNILSFLRIALIPVVVVLVIDRDTTLGGILLFAAAAATDWVDGFLARRLGQVSEVGKMLDPTADRLAMGAGLVALAVRGAFPWWAAALILGRDAVVLGIGVGMFLRRRVRIDVRPIGKLATFSLMVAVTWISWGNLGYALDDVALVVGWAAFATGIVEYYVAAGLYLGDIRRGLAEADRTGWPGPPGRPGGPRRVLGSR